MFSLPDDMDPVDVAIALDYRLGRIYGGNPDSTVWKWEGFWADVSDGAVKPGGTVAHPAGTEQRPNDEGAGMPETSTLPEPKINDGGRSRSIEAVYHVADVAYDEDLREPCEVVVAVTCAHFDAPRREYSGYARRERRGPTGSMFSVFDDVRLGTQPCVRYSPVDLRVFFNRVIAGLPAAIERDPKLAALFEVPEAE